MEVILGDKIGDRIQSSHLWRAAGKIWPKSIPSELVEEYTNIDNRDNPPIPPSDGAFTSHMLMIAARDNTDLDYILQRRSTLAHDELPAKRKLVEVMIYVALHSGRVFINGHGAIELDNIVLYPHDKTKDKHLDQEARVAKVEVEKFREMIKEYPEESEQLESTINYMGVVGARNRAGDLSDANETITELARDNKTLTETIKDLEKNRLENAETIRILESKVKYNNVITRHVEEQADVVIEKYKQAASRLDEAMKQWKELSETLEREITPPDPG